MKSMMARKRPDVRDLGPWAGFRDIEDRLTRLLGGFPLDFDGVEGAWMPAVDLREDKEGYTLVADLPGVKKEELELSVVDDIVTLKGQRSGASEQDVEGYHRIERSYGSFQRAFRIPGGVDAAKVTAKFENGVLTATLPKREENRPKQITVEVK